MWVRWVSCLVNSHRPTSTVSHPTMNANSKRTALSNTPVTVLYKHSAHRIRWELGRISQPIPACYCGLWRQVGTSMTVRLLSCSKMFSTVTIKACQFCLIHIASASSVSFQSWSPSLFSWGFQSKFWVISPIHATCLANLIHHLSFDHHCNNRTSLLCNYPNSHAKSMFGSKQEHWEISQ